MPKPSPISRTDKIDYNRIFSEFHPSHYKNTISIYVEQTLFYPKTILFKHSIYAQINACIS